MISIRKKAKLLCQRSKERSTLVEPKGNCIVKEKELEGEEKGIGVSISRDDKFYCRVRPCWLRAYLTDNTPELPLSASHCCSREQQQSAVNISQRTRYMTNRFLSGVVVCQEAIEAIGAKLLWQIRTTRVSPKRLGAANSSSGGGGVGGVGGGREQQAFSCRFTQPKLTEHQPEIVEVFRAGCRGLARYALAQYRVSFEWYWSVI
ncbi:hypothetical protein M0804_005611 [Polistes exclamans]|nr:hypothetical protein M0804_005611 [Polistes exclamans]